MIGLARRANAPTTPTAANGQPDDAPPAAFIERVPSEAGDVILAPFLDTLRAALAKHRRPASDASTSAPEALTDAPPEDAA